MRTGVTPSASSWLRSVGGKRPRPKPHWSLVRHLDVSQAGPERDVERVARAAQSPWLEGLRVLSLPGRQATHAQEDLAHLLGSSRLGGLRVLNMRGVGLSDGLARVFFGNPSLGGLRALTLGSLNAVADDGPLRETKLDGLQTLTLTLKRSSAERVVALLEAPALAGLRTVRLQRDSYFNSRLEVRHRPNAPCVLRAALTAPRALEVLGVHPGELARTELEDLVAEGVVQPALRRLELPYLAESAAQMLASWPQLATLERLVISPYVRLDARVLAVLFASPHLAGLRALDLSKTQGLAVGRREALDALGQMSGLRELVLDDIYISGDDLARLLRSPGLGELEVLSLANIDLNAQVIDALIKSPRLGNLRRLDLRGCKIHQSTLRKLAGSHLRPVVEGVAGLDEHTAWHQT